MYVIVFVCYHGPHNTPLPTTINQVKANVTDPYAYLAIQLQQEPNSFQIITEINPFDIAEMLGNIGGFWGKLTFPYLRRSRSLSLLQIRLYKRIYSMRPISVAMRLV